MAKKKGNFFWTSFTDLMISLFFLMLVLFAILNRERELYQQDAKYLLNLKKIDEQIEALEKTGEFRYEEKYKRHLLTKEISFERNKYEIKDIGERNYLSRLARIVDTLIQQQQNDSVRYMVIIEGMASKAGPLDANYILSYQRAYEVFKIWQSVARRGDISFINDTEVLIAGSGEGGVGRYSGEEDRRNQRFLIQVIPKTRIETSISLDM